MWKEKLTSRKFWACVLGFITAVLSAFNIADDTQSKIVCIVGALATLIIYILAEANVDSNR